MKGKHAYLIMAHDNFEQLKLLLQVLDHPRTDLYIHIDKKSSFDDYESLKNCISNSYIEIFSEIKVYWSDYSITECEILLLERAKNKGPYEYYHLISNADFPIRNQTEILNFFDKNYGKEFVSFRFPMNLWPFQNKPYETEIKYYHPFTRHLRTKSRILNTIIYILEYSCVFFQFLLRINRINHQYVSCKGSQWWSITDAFATYVLSKKEWIYKNYKNTRASDEVFVSVLAYNSKFREKLYDQTFVCSNNANQRLIDWKRGFPYQFDIEDYNEIITSGLMFVRKTNMNSDHGLVKKLYERIKYEDHE